MSASINSLPTACLTMVLNFVGETSPSVVSREFQRANDMAKTMIWNQSMQPVIQSTPQVNRYVQRLALQALVAPDRFRALYTTMLLHLRESDPARYAQLRFEMRGHKNALNPEFYRNFPDIERAAVDWGQVHQVARNTTVAGLRNARDFFSQPPGLFGACMLLISIVHVVMLSRDSSINNQKTLKNELFRQFVDLKDIFRLGMLFNVALAVFEQFLMNPPTNVRQKIAFALGTGVAVAGTLGVTELCLVPVMKVASAVISKLSRLF